MYKKYYTAALVLSSREQGEADKVFTLYTNDFGLVYGRASAVRSESSRMRFALQNYSKVNAGLVRGKRGWRVGGATFLSSLPLEGAKVFARISRLMTRLVRGEDQNSYLFEALSEAHGALSRENKTIFPIIELVCVARILFALGYISEEALSTALFTHTAYTGESLLEAETMRDKLLVSINKAIAETHL